MLFGVSVAWLNFDMAYWWNYSQQNCYTAQHFHYCKLFYFIIPIWIIFGTVIVLWKTVFTAYDFSSLHSTSDWLAKYEWVTFMYRTDYFSTNLAFISCLNGELKSGSVLYKTAFSKSKLTFWHSKSSTKYNEIRSISELDCCLTSLSSRAHSTIKHFILCWCWPISWHTCSNMNHE